MYKSVMLWALHGHPVADMPDALIGRHHSIWHLALML